MRCPMCKARVRDQDDLQIHYMESCDAIGDQQDEDLGKTSGRKLAPHTHNTSQTGTISFQFRRPFTSSRA